MNNKIGLISIIMAAYNAEKTIGAAISSVINQTYRNWELIVVNDCSKDCTEEIVKELMNEDKRIKLISNEKNSGASQTRHNGLITSNGMWIAVLDSDDIWREDKLEKQVILQQKTGAEILFTGSSFIHEDGKEIQWNLHVPSEIDYKKLLKQNLISNSSVLVKKDLMSKFEAIGDYMHEDFACWLQILRLGKIAYGIDEPLLIYRLSANSKSGNKIKAAKMNWNTYRYIGLNVFETSYYMVWYVINGLLKYRNLK